MFFKSLQNSQENSYVGVSFLIKLQALGLQPYEKKTPAQVLSCEFYASFKNIYFDKHHLQTIASVDAYALKNTFIWQNFPPSS